MPPVEASTGDIGDTLRLQAEARRAQDAAKYLFRLTPRLLKPPEEPTYPALNHKLARTIQEAFPGLPFYGPHDDTFHRTIESGPLSRSVLYSRKAGNPASLSEHTPPGDVRIERPYNTYRFKRPHQFGLPFGLYKRNKSYVVYDDGSAGIEVAITRVRRPDQVLRAHVEPSQKRARRMLFRVDRGIRWRLADYN